MQASRNIAAAMRGAEAVQNLTSEEEAGFLSFAYIFQCFVKDHTEKK